MNNRDKNKTRNPAEFIRYRKSEMTGEERNSFERDLQKDPFAEEASEGFSLLTAEEAEKDISGLKKKLEARRRKSSTAIYYRIAAAVAVLVTVSIVFFNRTREPDIILSKSDLEKPETTLVIAASEPLMDKTEKAAVRNEPMNRTLIDSPQQPVSQSLTPNEYQQVAISSELEVEAKEEGKGEQKEDIKATPVIVEDNYSQPAEAEKKMEMSKVAGAAAPMAAKRKSAPDHIPPQPVTGIDSFNIYLELNVRNPQPESDQERFVTISFTVRTDSTLTDLKVIESPGQAYTREANRLMKDGPKWKPAMMDGIPVEAEYRITIRFR